MVSMQTSLWLSTQCQLCVLSLFVVNWNHWKAILRPLSGNNPTLYEHFSLDESILHIFFQNRVSMCYEIHMAAINSPFLSFLYYRITHRCSYSLGILSAVSLIIQIRWTSACSDPPFFFLLRDHLWTVSHQSQPSDHVLLVSEHKGFETASEGFWSGNGPSCE